MDRPTVASTSPRAWDAEGLADSHVGEIGFSVMRQLSTAYADHVDYDERWLP